MSQMSVKEARQRMAGLKKGDIITKFDGSSVTSMSGLKETLAYYAAGEEVPVTISRQSGDGYEEQKVTLTLVLQQITRARQMTAITVTPASK